jgi:fatty-acyl-CoA synthase
VRDVWENRLALYRLPRQGDGLAMSIAESPDRRGESGKAAARAWLRALQATAPIAAQLTRTLPARLDELADTHGEKPALLSVRECLTYRELTERANRYARWALAQGISKGDVVCLLMPNCPDYLAIWLGVTRIGGIVALLNTHLAGPALAHCIDVVGPSHIIVAAELLGAFDCAQPRVTEHLKLWHYGADGPFQRIDREIECHSPARLADWEQRPITIEDRALLIYTSGTTGLPKAANLSHYRVLLWSYWFAGMMDTRPSDRMYVCLPMYHGVGGIVAIGAVLVHGGSVVIREKFSARQFWDDIARSRCTLFQYIGEICRYLVNSEPHPNERDHQIRLCCGNGLRADVWNEFKNRFRIPQILEFYAATEANFSLYNAEGEPGAIGRVPPFLRHRLPIALVRFNVESGEPFRGADGFCVRASAGEVGEAIGLIPKDRANIAGRFEGYTSQPESDNKVLRDVFEVGDAWFRSGDLMRCDERGFFYFVDRVGDNFRWKGENVATSEVAGALTGYPGIMEANVYGVAVAGAEGRAVMAAIVTDDRFDLAGLRAHLTQRLPPYAHPVFLRIQKEIEVTATFRHKKNELAQSGFDPALISDPIYFNDPEREAFVPLDPVLHKRIRSGSVRL